VVEPDRWELAGAVNVAVVTAFLLHPNFFKGAPWAGSLRLAVVAAWLTSLLSWAEDPADWELLTLDSTLATPLIRGPVELADRAFR
jgi:hypothetical protein